jgi:orotidine-5'-phosphate decarboxylase
MSQFQVNREVVDATKEHAAAYKLNMAFYESEGESGLRAMTDTVAYIRDTAPHSLAILDGKKGDIGNTSEAYAKAAFITAKAHSVTLNAYMGSDAVCPFSSYKDRLSFILCRTSNKGAGQVQDLSSPSEPLFVTMARLVRSWNVNGNLGLVVGATFPDELGLVRSVVGEGMPILVPGIGAQGGDLRRVLEVGTDSKGAGVLINVSRDIMFSFMRPENSGRRLGVCAGEAARGYREMVRTVLEGLDRW